MPEMNSGPGDLHDTGATSSEELGKLQCIGDERSAIAERLMAAVEIDPDTGCWLWTHLSRYRDGYGQIRFKGTKHKAHRLSYETFVGPIPDGLVLDHLCRVRHCINPAHLEPVTQAENLRRGMAPAHITHRTGVCQRGHVITGYNAQRQVGGWTNCRECRNASKRRYFARKRATKGAAPQRD